MPFRVGPTELIILMVIVMMVFGVGRLPQVGGAIGKAMREFRRAESHDDEPASLTETSDSQKAPTKTG